jgi:hypothetical protein
VIERHDEPPLDGHAVMRGDVMKRPQLAPLGPLTICHVQQGQLVRLRGNGRSHAGVHAPRHQHDGDAHSSRCFRLLLLLPFFFGATCSAVMIEWIPPRVLNAPVTFMERGAQTATRSSRIWLTALSK